VVRAIREWRLIIRILSTRSGGIERGKRDGARGRSLRLLLLVLVGIDVAHRGIHHHATDGMLRRDGRARRVTARVQTVIAERHVRGRRWRRDYIWRVRV
jgi:hypothetical protein